jgi:tRNA (guanine37-N1)-methyltransferase
MRIDIISLFPEFVAQIAGHGVVGRAQERGLLSIHGWNPRDYAEGNYRRVDDRPFGGGPGMVMLIEPLRAALRAARAADPRPARVIYMSPQGRPLTQAKARALAGLASTSTPTPVGPEARSAGPNGERKPERLILLCGRYEGVDERLLLAEVDEELSIGDYVLSGGELAAAVLIDAVARLLPGALNDTESAAQDSFEGRAEGAASLLDCPHYTRPVEHELGRVPDVLLSGHHADIARWRRQQSLGRTWLRRPDLIDRTALSRADRALLEAFLAEQAAAPPASIVPAAPVHPARDGDPESDA